MSTASHQLLGRRAGRCCHRQRKVPEVVEVDRWKSTTRPRRTEGTGKCLWPHGYASAPGEQQRVSTLSDVLVEVRAEVFHRVIRKVNGANACVGLGRSEDHAPVVQLYLRLLHPHQGAQRVHISTLKPEHFASTERAPTRRG